MQKDTEQKTSLSKPLSSTSSNAQPMVSQHVTAQSVNRALVNAGASRDEQILTAGTEIGALLVDGLGDGVLIECPGEDLETLRLMSFGLLQVRNPSAASTIPDTSCSDALRGLESAPGTVRDCQSD